MLNWKTNRKILLGITGGIAAYKIPELVRLITKANCEVEIIMTEAAKKFVAPMTLATLSKRKVWTDDDFDHTIPHIRLSEWADVFVIAPCTANTAAKISLGIADNLLTSTVSASKCPVIVFPAMNERMYKNDAVQENLENIDNIRHGYYLIDPDIGQLACGTSGKGRMPEPREIMHEIFRGLCPVNDMYGKKVLVTAGPTHEYIDPVRFISNPSSGKMGLAMARAAWYRGADVKIIAGPVDLDTYGMEIEHVVSAEDMFKAVEDNLKWARYIVKAAAVGDFKAKDFRAQKIKREGREVINLKLIQNPDIAAAVGKLKRKSQTLIGFAAETDNVAENARAKLARKNLDYILANDVLAEGSGFQSDTNSLRLIPSDENEPEHVLSGLKEDIAFDVWSHILA